MTCVSRVAFVHRLYSAHFRITGPAVRSEQPRWLVQGAGYFLALIFARVEAGSSIALTPCGRKRHFNNRAAGRRRSFGRCRPADEYSSIRSVPYSGLVEWPDLMAASPSKHKQCAATP